MLNRREFLILGATASASLLLPRFGFAKGSGHTSLLNPRTQPRFVNPLPIPGAIDLTGGGFRQISITQQSQFLGLYTPSGNPLMTTVWGYGGTYPGPTIVARSGVPVAIQWSNELRSGETPLPHLLPVDTSVHWADPMEMGHTMGPFGGPVPVVTHLHGGHTRSDSDGLPDAWFTPGFEHTGPLFNPVCTYDHDQEAGTLWYHDHALGITRLNVYAGLAGFYLLRDENEDYLVQQNLLPSGPYEIGLAIQDRMFTADGQLFMPSEAEDEGQPEPSILPEFFGDVMLVNGMAWPYLEVEPRQYRFRFLNGCDSRFLSMHLSEGLPFWQIGTDLGLLEHPVRLSQLTLGPGERADVVLDFSHAALAGKSIVLTTTGKKPFPKGEAVDPQADGRIMAFNVTRPLDATKPLTALPGDLRPLLGAIQEPAQTGPTRKLLLFEGTDEYGRLKPMLGTLDGAKDYSEPTTELPHLGETEVWEVYNSTMDAHPIHLHLTAFQILNRQKFRANQDMDTGALSNIRLLGKPKPPSANERGWKDTAQMLPGEVTRIKMTFDRPGEYVWHCHILSHEDHEMMRRFCVLT